MKTPKGYKWIKNEIEGGHTHLVNVKTGICKSCNCKIKLCKEEETCERCGKITPYFVKEAHDNINNKHFIAKKQGICFKCKGKLGFKSLKQIDKEIGEKEKKK